MTDLSEGSVSQKTAQYRPASDASLQDAKGVLSKSYVLSEIEVFEDGYLVRKAQK